MNFYDDMSSTERRACQSAHNRLKEEEPGWYKSVVEDVAAGKDPFTIHNVIMSHLNDHKLAARCKSTAKWLYREREIDRQAKEADAEIERQDRTQRRRRRRR